MPPLRAAGRMRPLLALLPLLGALLLAGPAGAGSVPAGFRETTVISGRTAPTAVRFAPDGRVFLAEKAGRLFAYDAVGDPTPVQVIDLRASVYNFWDRGLLGLAVHPAFPTVPEVFVFYAHDTWPPGDPRFGDPTAPRWGTGEPAPADDDPCPTPPGATQDGCVVFGRLSRIVLDPGTLVGSEQVLLEGNWCQQYPSHSAGDLAFGPDGYLYVSAGEGAAFHRADFGQGGSPINPCDDPPDGIGGPEDGVDAEGGALRSQDLLTPGDPTAFGGSILRIDVSTTPVSAPPDNPLVGVGAADDDLVVAMGLRNPFRVAFRPGTSELWLGDVGWNTWEEINRIADPTGTVEDFGWPCYEGDASGVNSTQNRQGSYDQQTLCQALYTGNHPPQITPVAPFWAYRHNSRVAPGDPCGTGGSSIAGMAFAQGGFPPAWDGALFFGDSTRECIWSMRPDAAGVPDPATVAPFVTGIGGPVVDLQWGPGGSLYYVEFGSSPGTGRVVRVEAVSGNQAPTASLVASPPSGPSPLLVQFDASASSDPEDGANLLFDWDLDGDGQLGDASGPTASFTYTQAGPVTVTVRVEDTQGASDSAQVQVAVDDAAPVVTMDAPAPDLRWAVDQIVGFSGSAVDPEDGPLPASRLSWEFVLHHCFDLTDCHTHSITREDGVASGTLVAPDHDYPAFLEFRLTARDLPPADWWDEAWPLRRRIAVDNSAQATTLVDFPVLVSLDPGRIDYGVAGPGGATLRFTDAGGALLPHEVESWNPGGVSRVWVKLPSVPAASAAGFFWMYYGNPGAAPAEDPAGVWSPDHVAVWHLHADLDDSTGNAHHGTDQGSVRVPGAVGDARHFDGASWIDVASTPALSLTGALTLEAWVALDDPDAPGGTRVLSKKDVWNGASGYELVVFPFEDIVGAIGSGGDWTTAYPAALDTSWHHVATTIQGGAGQVFVDGVRDTYDALVSPLAAGAQPLAIGRRSGGGDFFRGAVDELRISRVARSADWVRAQHLSMTDALLGIGPPQAQGVQQTTVSRMLDPEAVALDLLTEPPGLLLSAGSESGPAPLQLTRIVNGTTTVSADSPQLYGGRAWTFDAWSDGGAATHDVITPAAPLTLTATYRLLPPCDDGLDNDGDGAVDWAGGPAGEPADPECAGDPSRAERPPLCGLGAELALALPVLAALRRRRRARA